MPDKESVIERKLSTLENLHWGGNLRDFEYVSHVIDLGVQYGVDSVFSRLPEWGLGLLCEWYRNVAHTRSADDVNPLSDSVWEDIAEFLSEHEKPNRSAR